MKLLTTGSWHTRTYYASVMLVCLSMPFAVRFNSIALIIAGCATILWYAVEGRKTIVLSRRLLILPCYYLLCFIAFATSDDTRSVLFDLEQKIPIIALPLIFMLGPGSGEDKFFFQSIFVLAVLIASLRIVPAGLELGFRADALFESFPVIRRPYLGMYCVIALFFCVEGVLAPRSKVQQGLYVAGAMFFAFFPFLILAKMAVVTMIAVAAFLVLRILIAKRKYVIVAIVTGVVAIGASFFFLSTGKGKDIARRVLTLSEFDWAMYDPQFVNSVNLRFIKWKCSADVLSQDHIWLSGAGTGDAQELLDNCYAGLAGKNSFLVVDNYNSHNQFFTTWLNLGLIAVIFLVGHYVYTLFLYDRSMSWIPLAFTIAIILFCFTESIFEVQKGIILYAFFQSLFLKTTTSQRR